MLSGQQTITVMFVIEGSSHDNCNRCYCRTTWNTLDVFCISRHQSNSIPWILPHCAIYVMYCYYFVIGKYDRRKLNCYWEMVAMSDSQRVFLTVFHFY